MTWDGSLALTSDGSRALLDDGSLDTCGQCDCGTPHGAQCPWCPTNRTPVSIAASLSGLVLTLSTSRNGIISGPYAWNFGPVCATITGYWTTPPASLNGGYTLSQVAGSPCGTRANWAYYDQYGPVGFHVDHGRIAVTIANGHFAASAYYAVAVDNPYLYPYFPANFSLIVWTGNIAGACGDSGGGDYAIPNIGCNGDYSYWPTPRIITGTTTLTIGNPLP